MAPVSFLKSLVTVRVADREILRAHLTRRGKDIILTETEGVVISAASPFAILLDRPELIAALQPEGAPVEIFCEGLAKFTLFLRRHSSGLRLILRTQDDEELEVHEVSIGALLPED